VCEPCPCPEGYVKDPTGVCKKIGGVCLPQSVVDQSSLESGICYINLHGTPTTTQCAPIKNEIYKYNDDEWFRNGDYASDYYKTTASNLNSGSSHDEIYSCQARAQQLANFCGTSSGEATYKTISPRTYHYDSQGQCVSTGECLDSWPKYKWILENGSCKESIVEPST